MSIHQLVEFNLASVLFAGYVIVAAVFLFQTFKEGQMHASGWDWARIAGMLLCLVWPVIIVASLAWAFWVQQRAPDTDPAADGTASRARPVERKIPLFGIEVSDLSFEDAVDRASAMIRPGGHSTLYFVNAHTLNIASTNPDYRRILRGADTIFGDGTGVRWAARLRGKELAANLNGTDLVPALLRRSDGLKCFIVGSAPEKIDSIRAEFSRRFPRVDLVGSHHGYLDDNTSRTVVQRINASGADLLLVGMGNPLQEQWIHRHRGALDVPLAIGVGGLFEYWSGALDRAPAWMRSGGIEWVHILRRQPWKARRYLIGNFEFVWRSLSWLYADTWRTGDKAWH
jgi:N-acetylglucosaminyldiphosphoundecaprenol N-acetyl-beta-D-mannosaminyltransferase